MAKILAIDDKMDNLVTLSALLKNLMPDCAVVTAQSGREGIEKAKAELPDAILLDVKMPDMDGFETCRRLKAEESTKHIPIIMITAIRTDPESRIKGLEIGADAFLSKPIDEAELVSQVKVALRIKKAEDALRREKDALEKEVQERTAHLINEVIVRKQAEEAMRQTAREWAISFDAMSDGVSIHAGDYTILKVNRALCNMLGKREEELIGKKCFDVFHGTDNPMAYCPIEMTRRTGKEEPAEFFEATLNAWLSVSSSPMSDDTGRLIRFVHVVSDITKRKQIEKVQAFLAQSSAGAKDEPFFEKLAGFLAQTLGMDFICIDRLEGDGLTARTLAVWHEGKFEDNVSYALKDTPCGDVVGQTVCCFPDSVRQLFPRDQVLQDLLAESYVGVTLWSYTRQPIGLIAVIGRKPLINHQSVESILEMVAVRAASELERLDAELLLRQSEEKFRRAVEYAPFPIMIHAEEGQVMAISQGWSDLSGYAHSDIPTIEHWTERAYGVRQQAIKEYIETLYGLNCRKDEGAYTIACKDGTKRIWDFSSAPLGQLLDGRRAVISMAKDITEWKQAEEEKRNLEERLHRSEKMEALGQLAGGVAHDLNNVLGVLMGYAELLVESLPEGKPLREYAATILTSSEKAAAIIQDLLTLARRGVVVDKVVDLKSIVSNLLATPEFDRLKDYHPRVAIKTDLEKDLLHIKGSPVHLEKTVMNLVSNAVEAIEGSGEVNIRAENRYLDKAIRGYDKVAAGEYVVLMVSDTGTGISSEEMTKMFEPFYTKKKMGRSGTGLGLAIVWGTVKDHSGYIDVQSIEGEGTTFTVYFPVTREKMEEDVENIPIAQYTGHGEAVLVVDDVPEQRKWATTLLTGLGYQVNSVASGEEAVEYLKGNKADILVLDMIMEPGIDGLETYQRILEINPHQKAILVSGFSETDRAKEARELGAGAYVKKPYRKEKIGVAIRDELQKVT